MQYDDKLKECAAEIFHFLGVEENPIKNALLRKILSDYFPEKKREATAHHCPQCNGRGVIMDYSVPESPSEYECPKCNGGGYIEPCPHLSVSCPDFTSS